MRNMLESWHHLDSNQAEQTEFCPLFSGKFKMLILKVLPRLTHSRHIRRRAMPGILEEHSAALFMWKWCRFSDSALYRTFRVLYWDRNAKSTDFHSHTFNDWSQLVIDFTFLWGKNQIRHNPILEAGLKGLFTLFLWLLGMCCGIYMFSPCLHAFPPGWVSSHRPKTCI